jgi:hypothetical protein
MFSLIITRTVVAGGQEVLCTKGCLAMLTLERKEIYEQTGRRGALAPDG